MHPTKRQIASVLRRTVRELPNHQRLTAALFSVCSRHGSKASTYYDAAVRAIKVRHAPMRFSDILRQPVDDVAKKLRTTARALEHGLPVER